MYDVGLADRLRAAGLRVLEVAGWQTRGSSSFDPIASVNHHTAAGGTGRAPSLGAIINGKPGVPGPLANVLQTRESDGSDDVFIVVAAGRANHAGVGGWRGVSGNSRAWGLEIEHNGISPLSERRQRLAARCHAAMISLRHRDGGWVCQHREWALPPGRKIDAATHVDEQTFRDYVAAAFPPPPSPDPPPTQQVVPPMYNPPLDLPLIVDSCDVPGGGVYLLGLAGEVMGFPLGIPTPRGANGTQYFQGRFASRISSAERGKATIIAHTGERYDLPTDAA